MVISGRTEGWKIRQASISNWYVSIFWKGLGGWGRVAGGLGGGGGRTGGFE